MRFDRLVELFPSGSTLHKDYWKSMSSTELDEFVDIIFQHYREQGYPYFHFSREKRLLELMALRKINLDQIIDLDTIQQTMQGLALLWSYFPHAINVATSGSHTPLENFMNDDVFKKVIRKRLEYGDYIGDSAIRKALRIYCGARQVSNFRPTAAAAIYNRYCSPGAKVWDMSAGFGGRLLGAAMSGMVERYIGNEPCFDTFTGLARLSHDLRDHFPMKSELYRLGSEYGLSDQDRASFDCCFTSPPYFDTEHYSDEATQSYLRFPAYDGWLNGYLEMTIRHCDYLLKPGGILIVNIANVASAATLVNDFLAIVYAQGFHLQEVLRLKLSGAPHIKGDQQAQFKYEPVFVFTKGDIPMKINQLLKQLALF